MFTILTIPSTYPICGYQEGHFSRFAPRVITTLCSIVGPLFIQAPRLHPVTQVVSVGYAAVVANRHSPETAHSDSLVSHPLSQPNFEGVMAMSNLILANF